MDKKKKIYLGVLVISLITLITGVSYAYIAYTAKQTSTNTIGTSCVKVTLSDVTNPISLDKAYPLKDSEAEQLTPYTFKIENNCDTPVTYKVDLDVLNTDKPTPLSDLAIQVDNNMKRILNSLDNSDNLIEDAYVAKEILPSGILNVGSSITHSIKIWLDESASNDSQNTTHNSKVVVTATQDTSLDVKDVLAYYNQETVYLTYKTFGSVDSVSCKYGLTADNLDQTGTNITKTSCELNPTNSNTTYYYEVCLTTQNGVNKCLKDTVDTRVEEITTEPILNTDNIEIPITTTGNNITCKYSTEANTYTTEGIIEGNICKITPIEQGRTYYYQICSTNELGNTGCITGHQATEVPTITIGNVTSTDTTITIPYTTTGTEVTVECKYGTSASDLSKKGTISGNTCTLSNLDSETAYYYELIATNKYLGMDKQNGSVATISPTLSIDEVRPTTSKATITFTTTGTGMTTTCKYGTSASSLTKTGTISGNTCTISSLSSSRTYYYEITTKNVNNITVTETGSFSTSTKIIYNNVNVGDYVAYTPSKTIYTISGTSTGCVNSNYCYGANSDGLQTINPSELNLWRVIKKNSDGTIEIVSEYTSSNEVYFYGKEGYRRFVATLNTVASAYEKSDITVSGKSRHVGGTGEQATCSSYTSCSDQKTSYTEDTPDTLLIKEALGTLQAHPPTKAMSWDAYWLASRYSNISFTGRTVYAGRWVNDYASCYYNIGFITNSEQSEGHYIRPIVSLKSELISTEGSKNGKKLWTVN